MNKYVSASSNIPSYNPKRIPHLIMPSFYAHVFGAILILIALFVFYNNYNIIVSDPYKLLLLIIVFNISVGIHGLSHLGLEYVYGYNPLDLSN